MFESTSLTMEGDHLDLSVHRTDEWLPSPLKSISVTSFTLGDSEVGPSVLVSRVANLPEEPLDWEHTIDPMHFHGSDQFRLVFEGEWVTARHPFQRGGFGFQESGRVYQEHPGEGDHSCLLLIYGDRRGEPATLTLERDRNAWSTDDVVGSPVAQGAYPHPAGPKGVPSIATTLGSPRRGVLWGSFSDTDGWSAESGQLTALAGVWGDKTAGPLVCLLKSGAGQQVVPRCTYPTEVLAAVCGGSCRIGDDTYEQGDLRVQRAGAPMGAIVSGDQGLEMALLVADRRAAASVVTSDDDGSGWTLHLQSLVSELMPETARPS